MKSQSMFSCLCQNLDYMERETESLCSFLAERCGKKQKKDCDFCRHISHKPPKNYDFCHKECEENG